MVKRLPLVPFAGFLISLGYLVAQSPVVPVPVATPLRAIRNGLQEPARVATDALGRSYVTDSGNGALFIRDETGALLRVIRGLARPLGIATDTSGRIFVAEAGTGSVSIYLADGTVLGTLGQGVGEFQLPNHIIVDPDPSGLIYVADSAANLIKVYAPTGAKVREFGTPGTGPGQFDFPTGLCLTPAGELVVADQNNLRIQILTREGLYLRGYGKSGMMGRSPYGRVQGLCADAQGRIYVADSFQGQVHVIDAYGKVLSHIGSFGNGPGQLSLPVSLALDRNNRLLVVSTGSTRIEVFGLDAYTDPSILQASFQLEQSTIVRAAIAGSSHYEAETDEDGRDEAKDRDEDHDGDDNGGGQGASSQLPDLLATLSVVGVHPGQVLSDTIRVNGVAPLALLPNAVRDSDGDGLPELNLQLRAADLLNILPDGTTVLFVTGQVIGGLSFEAANKVTVVPGENPAGGHQKHAHKARHGRRRSR